MPVCLVTSEWTGNNAGCVLTFSGQGGSFLVLSAIGAFHAEDSRLSGNSIDEWLQKLFRKHLPQFKKSGTVVCRISLTRLYLGNAKKALISGLAPPPRRWENQIGFLRAFFGKGAITLCLRMTEKIEEYDEMTCES